MVKSAKRSFRFSQAEHEQVMRAVREAERSTTGEIVSWIVPQCKGYRWVHGVLALTGIAVSTSTLSLVYRHRLWDLSFMATVGWQCVGALIGLALSWLAPVKRALIPEAWMEEEVRDRALAGFVKARLTETRDRNGVLIFISLFERRVQILADRGIHERVPQGYWDERVCSIIEGVRAGKPVPALCRCIEEIGQVLSRHFPAREEGERRNQLPDEMRED